MKCVITGHTKGLGKALYNHFQTKDWTVIGLSSSNGYMIPEKINDVVTIAAGCDLFINNSYVDGHQIDLLKELKNKVENMVVCGSIARTLPMSKILEGEYVDVKIKLANECQRLSISNDPTIANIIHLDLGFLEGSVENPLEPSEFISDYNTEFNDVIAAIELWLQHPKIRQIEFAWKLTPFLKPRLKRAAINKDAFDQLLNDLDET